MSHRDTRDLSASWESDSIEQASTDSASSEEGHVANYRAFLGKSLACDAHSGKKKHKRMVKAEEMKDLTAELGDCVNCRSQGLACPACQAKRKHRQQQQEEEEEKSVYSMPILYQRPYTESSPSTLQSMLKMDSPLPGMVAVSIGSNNNINNTNSMSLSSPYTPSSTPLPKLVYFSGKAPGKSEKKSLDEPSSIIKPLPFQLPNLVDVRPKQKVSTTPNASLAGEVVTTTSLDSLRLDRMSLQFRETKKISNPVIQSLLQNPFQSTQRQLPLSCHTGEQMRIVKCHIRTCHNEYFDLLEQNGLMEEMQNLMLVDDSICFLFVVPVKSVLATIVEIVSPETARLLRYHIIKIQQGQTFDTMSKDRIMLPTLLSEKDLEVEMRDQERYVGGYQTQNDSFYPDHIVHIRGLLDASGGNVGNPVIEDDQPGVDTTDVMKEGGDDDSTSEVELPPPQQIDQTGDETPTNEVNSFPDPPSDLPPTLEEGTQQLIHTQSRLSLVTKDSRVLHDSLLGVVDRLNMSYFNAQIDLKAQQSTVSNTRPVILTLRTYNTQSLWQRCLQAQLPDITRLKAQRHIQQLFQRTPHFVLEDGMRLTEYEWRGPLVTLHELSQGLCELSFDDPLAKNESTTRILCKLQQQQPLQQQQQKKSVTFMTDNEHILLRFSTQGHLSTVLINHLHAMTQSSDVNENAQSHRHFFELFLNENARERFTRNLSKLEFDALLLQEGTLSKYTKKAKKYVRRKARNALSGAQAQKKKQLALKLMAVPKPDTLASIWKETQGAQSGKRINVRVYDRQMRMRDQESQSDLAATRYANGPQIWYQLQEENQLYDQLQRTDNYYVELDVDQWRGLTFNAAMITSGSQLYYASGTGDDVYVLLFEGHGLKGVAKISRHSAFYKQMK